MSSLSYPLDSASQELVDEDDFELVEDVEWGDGSNELAVKPKADRHADPCDCFRDENSQCLDMSCVYFACQEECPRDCLNRNCQNKRIQRKQWKRLQVIKTPQKGRGLTLLEDVKKGDFLVEYVGRAVPKHYLTRLFSKYKHERKLYIMALDKDIYLDARQQGGIARYINHSCDPNCVVERWKVRGVVRAGVFAAKDITTGQELTFDYQWTRKRGRAPTKCYCQAHNCRGTLEVPRSMEEASLERKLSNHWKKALIRKPGKEIINRTIQIFNKENQEYFQAGVCRYDENTGKHLVVYMHDVEEVWEDLGKEEWLILDEEADHFFIARKQHTNTPPSSLLLAASSQDEQRFKNFIFVSTTVKDALWNKHLVERCERNCNVQIQAQQFARPPLPPNPDDVEDLEKHKALQELSNDGTVWKISIQGSQIEKAYDILSRNSLHLHKLLTEPPTTATPNNTYEVVIPRCVVDVVKRRLPLIRDKCRSVNVSFAPSESKSKQFAKLILEGTLVSDIDNAKENLWKQLVAACEEVDAPKAPSQQFQNLGFWGGELTNAQFRLLLHSESGSLRQDCTEDLQTSPFFTSFESTYRCTIWVQSEDDKGRIDSSNRIVNEATPNAPRKIFFGCSPTEIPKLWSLVQTRANELARGVKYLYLGTDRLFLKFMMDHRMQFFEYVKHVTGASVTVDNMTGDHLRVDGREENTIDLTARSESERASLAEAIVRLQIELYRDHYVREENWIFGRDWTYLPTQPTVGDKLRRIPSKSPATPSTSKLLFDTKTVVSSCKEISEIVAALGHAHGVAAHAVVILYRFMSRLSPNTLLKAREVVLACVFLANKSQKNTRWKGLDAVLEAAYKTFYPGTMFDSSKEEALVWEEKVISAEAEVLEALDYDIFWAGVDWIHRAATEAAGMSESDVRKVQDYSFSTPVFAVGPKLWLKYSAEYVFVAIAGFLDKPLEPLFSALSVMPLKMLQAAELIADSAVNSPIRRKNLLHSLFRGRKNLLADAIARIKETCLKTISSNPVGSLDPRAITSEAAQRYRIIASRDRRRRIFRGVDRELVKNRIVPVMYGLSAESKCIILVGGNSEAEAEDVVLEGSWRSLAIAEHLLRTGMNEAERQQFPVGVDEQVEAADKNKLQAKVDPGLVPISEIQTAEGWEGTIQSETSNNWGRKTGGKYCVPARVLESSLREAGLRWWIPSRCGPSPTGAICDMFVVRNHGTNQLEALAELAQAYLGESNAFSTVISDKATKSNGASKRYVAVSLQRWPSEKIETKEKAKEKERSNMQVGFSAIALQEMQSLTQMHSLIPSPQGHPNFILPVGIAVPVQEDSDQLENGGSSNGRESFPTDEIFSLFRNSDENEKLAQNEMKRKGSAAGPHLFFQPTPFVLARFITRKRKRDADSDTDHRSLSPAILSTWFHDLLSGLVHCHSNHVVVRSFHMEQIAVDHSGVAKIGTLHRATFLPSREWNKPLGREDVPARRKGKTDELDVNSNPFFPPEILLGSHKNTPEGDIWALGCLLAHLLLNKPLFVGKDRKSLLQAMFKIVGMPSEDNFPLGLDFPYYREPRKPYRRGVEKALKCMLGEEESKNHEGAIDLLAKMLHLDPAKRITAVDALKHHYMQNFIENSCSEAFQQKYVQDWLALKGKIMKSTKTEEDEARERERQLKRKAMLMAATRTNDSEEGDDLYDMEDLLSTKKHKSFL